ncbi:MAG TPA: hypothetical protein VIL21_09535 [Solirubrobacterales bacterium]|jgi:hypothetical protein
MKYVKMLGLLAVAAAALMAFAASASATTVTSPTGTTYTGEIHAVAIGEPPTLHGAVTITCTSSTAKGTVETHSSTTTAHGPITSLTFTECHENIHVEVKKPGRLIVHTDEEEGAGKHDGTVTSDGAAILIQVTNLGISCEYTTSETHIGTLDSSETTGGHAILTIKTAKIPRTGGSIFCGSSGVWTGEYTVTTPSKLYIQ